MSALQVFLRSSDRVVEFKEYFIALPRDQHTIHMLEVHKDDIVRIWNDLRTCYDDLLSKLQSKEEETDFISIKGKLYAVFNAHLICLSTANELLGKLTCKATAASDNNEVRPIPSIALPPCDMY